MLLGLSQLLVPVNRYSQCQDHWTTFDNSSAFLGFVSQTAFLMSPHKFSIGLRLWGLGWQLYNINLVGLEPRRCFLTGLFGVIDTLTPMLRAFPLRHKATWPLEVFWCIQTDPWSQVWDKKAGHHRNVPISWWCLVVVWQTVCGP